ncbi:hypothetical protein DIT68_08565 [Brumimicrobium oceani]|uniref:Uncharacterized protein n=1 Tax=Brumimicrobium oceani TaxID=2100725 RepID=A0A2U2XD41_9FLAO|nr:hypothetical protein DIT68_08565 [Brumimicrobium oceani]
MFFLKIYVDYIFNELQYIYLINNFFTHPTKLTENVHFQRNDIAIGLNTGPPNKPCKPFQNPTKDRIGIQLKIERRIKDSKIKNRTKKWRNR